MCRLAAADLRIAAQGGDQRLHALRSCAGRLGALLLAHATVLNMHCCLSFWLLLDAGVSCLVGQEGEERRGEEVAQEDQGKPV